MVTSRVREKIIWTPKKIYKNIFFKFIYSFELRTHLQNGLHLLENTQTRTKNKRRTILMYASNRNSAVFWKSKIPSWNVRYDVYDGPSPWLRSAHRDQSYINKIYSLVLVNILSIWYILLKWCLTYLGKYSTTDSILSLYWAIHTAVVRSQTGTPRPRREYTSP